MPYIYTIDWYRIYQLDTHMTAVFNPLFLKYWSLHTASLRDCMIEIPIIANPRVSDLTLKQEQSLEHSDGCMTSMLAIVVLGFH